MRSAAVLQDASSIWRLKSPNITTFLSLMMDDTMLFHPLCTVFSSYSWPALVQVVSDSSALTITFTKMSSKNQTWDFPLVCSWWLPWIRLHRCGVLFPLWIPHPHTPTFANTASLKTSLMKSFLEVCRSSLCIQHLFDMMLTVMSHQQINLTQTVLCCDENFSFCAVWCTASQLQSSC